MVVVIMLVVYISLYLLFSMFARFLGAGAAFFGAGVEVARGIGAAVPFAASFTVSARCDVQRI
jgi:uncharacterized membrane protein (DUF485 family)